MTPRALWSDDVRDLFQLPNLHARDKERGYTCLHWLVVTGHDRPLRKLLQHGADPTLRDFHQLSALDRACHLGRFSMVQTMIQACPAAVHTRRPCDGRTPLHFANASGDTNTGMVTLLLECGANVNATTTTRLGRTVLHESVLRHAPSGHLDILLAYGAHLHATDVHGWTPLHYATYLGHVDTVEQLLLYGANPTATDHQGRTPLHLVSHPVTLPPQSWDVDISTTSSSSMWMDTTNDDGNDAPSLETTAWSLKKFGRRTPADLVRLLVRHGATSWESDNQHNLTFFRAASGGAVDVCFEILQVAAMEGLFG